MIVKKTKVFDSEPNKLEVKEFIEVSKKDGNYLKHYLSSGYNDGAKKYLLEVRIDKEES
jgi:hypothetical protein